MTKSQRDVLSDAFRALYQGAQCAMELVSTNESDDEIAQHITDLATLVRNIEDAFGRSVGARAILERVGERAKVLSSSKP